jgi:hypothetical protein
LSQKVRERLSVTKRTTGKFHMDGYKMKKLNEKEGREEYAGRVL